MCKVGLSGKIKVRMQAVNVVAAIWALLFLSVFVVVVFLVYNGDTEVSSSGALCG